MTTDIEQVRIAISFTSGCVGGSYPTYNDPLNIDAVGSRFCLLPESGNNPITPGYRVRTYKLLLRSPTADELTEVITALESVSSAALRNTSYKGGLYTKTYLPSESKSFKITDIGGGVYNFTFNAAQTEPIGFYNTDYLMLIRFRGCLPFVANLNNFIWYITPGATVEIGEGKTVSFMQTTNPAPDIDNYDGAVYLTEEWGYNDGSYLVTTWENQTQQSLTTPSAGSIEYAVDKGYLDFLLEPSWTTATSKIYGAGSTTYYPYFTYAHTFGSTYPFWIEIKFDYDASTKNEFIAVFDVEARWAL
jgi:hypothetical protein